MDIVEKNINDIIPYDNNPRINDEAVPYVAESIQKFGWQQPIVIDRNNIIIAGHTRYKAALKLGLDTIPCKYADELTEDEVNAYRLADNKTAELATWDNDKLIEELQKIAEFDMAAFGFDEYEEPEDTSEIIEDEYEEPEDLPATAKPGMIFKLGEHRLMCGDATDAEAVDKLIDGADIDLFLTDPPYNCNVGECEKPYSTSEWTPIANDNMPRNDFINFLIKAFTNAKEHMRPGAAFYVFSASLTIDQFLAAIHSIDNFKLSEELVWVKSHFVMGRNSDYQWQHEPCLYGWKQGANRYFFDSRAEGTVYEDRGAKLSTLKKDELIKLCEQLLGHDRATTILRYNKPAFVDQHPTIKPQELIAYLIRNSSKKEWNVLDLFGGSGSTLIASEQMGRKCYTMELDPHYCDVIIDRWQKFTGKEAELIND